MNSLDIAHHVIRPKSTYAPWASDGYFRKLYKICSKYSLVDKYRMFELWMLAKQAARLSGDFLEVGVWRGGTSSILQAAIGQSNSPSTLYIADTFTGVVKAGSDKDSFYKGGEHADASLESVRELFSLLKLPFPVVLEGIFPDDHPGLNIDKIAFLHTDVDAYESTKGVIEWTLPRLVEGGIIVFDDYGFRRCDGVTRYVNELMNDEQIANQFIFIHNLNGHAIMVKVRRNESPALQANADEQS